MITLQAYYNGTAFVPTAPSAIDIEAGRMFQLSISPIEAGAASKAAAFEQITASLQAIGSEEPLTAEYDAIAARRTSFNASLL